VDRFASGEGASLAKDAKYQALVARVPGPNGDVWLCEPQTYMNLSGKSVGGLARFYKIPPEEILVVHDELDFAPGVAKLKLGGGVAGHNGLKDIQAQLGTQGFWRLRIGIGHPGDRNLVADYVLNSPPPAERELIEQSLERALGVLPDILAGDMQLAIQKLHGAGKERKKDGDQRGGDKSAPAPKE
jgi:PTH1 family peptidyl-tRNA hydrolase